MEQHNWCIELGADIIAKAIKDLKFISHKKTSTARIGREALRFLKGDGLDGWCYVLNLNAEHIRKKLRETNEIYKKYE